MALTAARYLVDKSALSRLGAPAVGARLRPMLVRGDLSICGTSMLEILYSARSADDHAAILEELRGLARVPVDDEVIDRAIEVQSLLARRGQHRGASLPDLILAAAAERAGLAVLHYDSDFDRITELTRQPCEWVVGRGTVD